MALVLLAEVSTLLYAGIIFGWSPLLHMFKNEGYYADECGPKDPWCHDQQNALAEVYTLGSTMQTACTFFVGLFMDMVGYRSLILVGSVLECLGLYFLLCFESPVMIPGVADWALPLGSILVSFGAMCFFQHTFSVSAMFPAKTVLIVALNCTLFDASSIIFVVAKLFYDIGVPLYAVGIFLIVLNVLVSGGIIYLRTIIPADPPKSTPGDSDNLRDSKGDLVYQLIEHRTFYQQIVTAEFGFILVYMSVHMTRSNLFLGILSPLFNSLHQPDTDAYIQIASFLVPAGAFFTPLVEYTINRLGGAKSAVVVHILGAVYGSLMFASLLWVQLIATGIFGFYRALLYSVAASYNIGIFGFGSLGRINGVMYSLTGLWSFIIAPALKYAQQTCGDDFDPLLGWQWLAMLPSFIYVVVLYVRSREPFIGGPRAVEPSGDMCPPSEDLLRVSSSAKSPYLVGQSASPTLTNKMGYQVHLELGEDSGPSSSFTLDTDRSANNSSTDAKC